MAIPFSPRAALCTFVVVAGLATAISAQLPGGLFGLVGMDREGLLILETGGRPPDANEKNEIVHAVLAQQAEGSNEPICVHLLDEGEALTRDRMEIAQLQRRVAGADATERAELVSELERRRSPRREWRRLGQTDRGGSAVLSEENANVLRAAETAVLGMPASGHADIMLDMSALPENLQARPPGCERGLGFTAPAIVGNIAFVETLHTCGNDVPNLCASGYLHALSRSGGRWQVQAFVQMWIS